MRFKKGKEEETGLGIAPLIDMVLLLLIFFMVTSHFDIATGVRIRLPEVSNKIFSEEKNNKITLVIDKSAQIYLEGKKIDQKTLQNKLQNLFNEKGVFHLILQADKDVPHGKVVEIMDLAKGAGVQSIIIAAQWKSERLL